MTFEEFMEFLLKDNRNRELKMVFEYLRQTLSIQVVEEVKVVIDSKSSSRILIRMILENNFALKTIGNWETEKFQYIETTLWNEEDEKVGYFQSSLYKFEEYKNEIRNLIRRMKV
ncbi:hypothetical protein [Neobacillus mesonae]|uniref:hypothetical protein n=1 Tax=Neobacillus mesonae TaxID=1193713 RepID=UPI002041A155|nr:hypothetical protein [Neobacillus mesonae]MCM3570256.1 hypothetical protein [Neobacillus mesonae]